jgi:hypothetical protein
MGGACGTNEREKYAYRFLVGNPEGESPLIRLRSRWVNDVKMDLREIERSGMKYIDLLLNMDQQRALTNAVMSLRVP